MVLISGRRSNVAPRAICHFEHSPIRRPKTLKVKYLLRHCVGVHGAYCQIYNEQEGFVRLQPGLFLTHGKNLTWKAGLSTDSAQNIQKLSTLGYTIEPDLETKYDHWSERVPMNSFNPTRSDYAGISALLCSKGICYFMGYSKHTLYVSLEPGDRHSQESIIYLVLFNLGSITRYNPYLYEEIFSDKEQ